ncbi:23496_t:CDS:1, partial [Dentiscutata erythropus]
MVSFSCDQCADVIKKPKLDQHRIKCPITTFTCIDCSKTFVGTSYKSHTSCISEAEKYQKGTFKPKK